MSDSSRLWEPIRIGAATSRNRIYLPAHLPSLSPEDYGLYLRERALGGVGLIVTHGTPIHVSSAGTAFPGPWRRENIPVLRQMMAPAQAEGSLVFLQLQHIGPSWWPFTYNLESWGPLWAPSAIPSAQHNHAVPKVIEPEEIEALIDSYAVCAQNVREAGGDGVEVLCAHGYLLSSFLSPYWNRRTDDYGGDTVRRTRIVREIGAAIRRRVGVDFAVGVRLNYDEYLGEVGTTPDEAMRVLEILHRAAAFDYFTLSHTDYHTNHHLIAPDASGVVAPLAPGGRRAREVVAGQVPILVHGSIRNIDTAADLVSRGEADMVGMVRAQIADPHLVNKSRSGRTQEIRRCVGANQGCWRRIAQPINCTVNPTTGREARYGAGAPKLKVVPQRILVVGAGPAGLKFADTAAEQGHAVTLWERAGELGGQLRYAARLPDYSSWRHLYEDLAASLARRAVDVRLNTEATVKSVAAFAADVTVVATGSLWDRAGFSTYRPDRDAISCTSSAQPLTPLEAMDEPARCGRNVLIVDDNGDYLPLGLGRMLASLGKTVCIVTADEMLGRKLIDTLERPWVYPRALEAGIKIVTSTYVERIEVGRVRLAEKWTGARSEWPADTVILSMMRKSDESLYGQLKARGLKVVRVGDCVAPREVDDAVLEGFRAAMQVASNTEAPLSGAMQPEAR